MNLLFYDPDLYTDSIEALLSINIPSALHLHIISV